MKNLIKMINLKIACLSLLTMIGRFIQAFCKLFTGLGRPIKAMTIVSYSPGAPSGERQEWTLIERTSGEGEFPLPKDALGSAQRTPPTPLVFVVNEAVRGKALGGASEIDDIKSDFVAATQDEKPMAAWLLGQKYIAYTGACKAGEEQEICGEISKLEQAQKESVLGTGAGSNQQFSDYIEGFKLASSNQTRAEAVSVLRPYLGNKETPAIVLRRAAMARAGLKKRTAMLAGLAAVKPEALLQQSLAKDPYDPLTYLGLAQVYAANGKYEQSWDIYDALRAGIPGAQSLNLKIDAVEDKLRKRAPGYFLD